MQSQRTAGLLVILNGEIKVERYGLEHYAEAPWVSFSVTKSVVSMLFGAAVKDGYIASIDDPVSDYLPVFANSPYADVSIKHILQMASGVAWNEDYADPASNIANLPTEELAGFRYMRDLPRVAKPGAVFNYNTGETNIAGAILRKAVGKNLSDYASEKVFLPGGISNTANWLLGKPNGKEFAGCCISANLRDYGRIGLFALQNFQASGPNRPLASTWMQHRQHHPRATTVTVFSGGSRIGAFSQPKVFLDSIFLSTPIVIWSSFYKAPGPRHGIQTSRIGLCPLSELLPTMSFWGSSLICAEPSVHSRRALNTAYRMNTQIGSKPYCMSIAVLKCGRLETRST